MVDRDQPPSLPPLNPNTHTQTPNQKQGRGPVPRLPRRQASTAVEPQGPGVAGDGRRVWDGAGGGAVSEYLGWVWVVLLGGWVYQCVCVCVSVCPRVCVGLWLSYVCIVAVGGCIRPSYKGIQPSEFICHLIQPQHTSIYNRDPLRRGHLPPDGATRGAAGRLRRLVNGRHGGGAHVACTYGKRRKDVCADTIASLRMY